MKFILASTVIALLASGTLAFAQNNLSGLKYSPDDPNFKQTVERHQTTGGVSVLGHACPECRKNIAKVSIFKNTNPDASPANLFIDVKDGKNPGTLDK